MGVDIYSRSGIVLTSEQLAQIINDGNRELACRTVIRFTANLLQSGITEDDERAMIKFLVARFRSLRTTTSLEALQQMLQEMAHKIPDGFDSGVINSEESVAVWGELIGQLYPNAPKPEGTVFIHSPRYQGQDLPEGEVLFVFSEDDCFERVKTASGEALDSMLGDETKLSTWTIYSA